MIATAFMLGLLGSFHCIGMCGPIAFLLPLNRENKWIQFGQIFIYHSARILTYALLGLIFGSIGKSLNLFGLQQQISISVGVLMIVTMIIPHKFWSKYRVSRPGYKVFSTVQSTLSNQLRKRTPATYLAIGFLNGILPCGLVYMAAFAAIATGEVLKGGLYMVAFGGGTIPLMTISVYLGNFLSHTIKTRIRKVVPFFIVLIGFLFILRGLGMGIPYVSPKPITSDVEVRHH